MPKSERLAHPAYLIFLIFHKNFSIRPLIFSERTLCALARFYIQIEVVYDIPRSGCMQNSIKRCPHFRNNF